MPVTSAPTIRGAGKTPVEGLPRTLRAVERPV